MNMIIKLENNNRWLLYSGGRPRAVLELCTKRSPQRVKVSKRFQWGIEQTGKSHIGCMDEDIWTAGEKGSDVVLGNNGLGRGQVF